MVGSSAFMPSGAPGRPTLVNPVRIGDWPVMNAARPAVQLCWPYQSVNIAPSFATRSIFGVRYPITPWLYALTLNQPMSSPQMTRMLGLDVFAITRPPLPKFGQTVYVASYDRSSFRRWFLPQPPGVCCG